jgi:hypothetical protein
VEPEPRPELAKEDDDDDDDDDEDAADEEDDARGVVPDLAAPCPAASEDGVRRAHELELAPPTGLELALAPLDRMSGLATTGKMRCGKLD